MELGTTQLPSVRFSRRRQRHNVAGDDVAGVSGAGRRPESPRPRTEQTAARPRPARLREAGFERLLSSQTRGGARGPRREHEEQAMPLSRVPQGPGTFASMLNHIKQKLLTPHEPPTGSC